MITEIGKHKVKLSNVIHGVDDLMGSDKADLFYVDMPWGQGNITYWETMRLKMNNLPKEDRRDTKFDELTNMVFSIASKYAKNIVLIEYGMKWKDDLIKMAKENGLHYHHTTKTQYKSGSKLLLMDLHIFSKNGDCGIDVNEFEKLVSMTYGYDTIKKACSFFVKPGGILLDSCCGMGYSAQVAIDSGMIFRGNEMNEKRLGKTIARLHVSTKKN